MDDGPLSTPLFERDRFTMRRRALIPALIALTSVLGAVGAWRASAASGTASGAERKAFADTVAAEQQRALIESDLGVIELAYARRAALEAAAEALRAQAAGSADPAEAARLTALAVSYEAAAEGFFVDEDALRPDGTLDLEAKRAVEWGLANDLADLDPGPEAAQADAYRAKAQRLVGLTALLIAAALFLTLAEVSRHPQAEALYWVGGAGVLAAAALLLLVVEVA